MRAGGPIRAVVLLGTGACAACSLLAPLDGLSGGGDDAGSPASDGPGGGGANDAAPAGDAPSSEDAGGGDTPPSQDAVATGCEGGLASCGGACVDVQTDAANCGRCAHDCGGGACVAGVCHPATIASGQAGARALTVAGGTVYWTTHATQGFVASCPASGCPSSGPAMLASGLQLGSGIAVTGGSLFFACAGGAADAGGLGAGVYACATSGCPAAPTDIAPGAGLPVGVTTDGTNVYWNDGSSGQVLACAVAGCSGGPTVVASGRKQPWYGIAVDATHVYWGDRGAGTIARCTLPSCAGGPQTLASAQAGPFALAIDATDVWFTSYDPANPTVAATGSVQRCPLSGCAGGPLPVASSQLTPSGIAVDATNVYWTQNGAGLVQSCPKTGCPQNGPTTLADNQGGPFLVALDASYVYWTNTGAGQVMRVAKP